MGADGSKRELRVLLQGGARGEARKQLGELSLPWVHACLEDITFKILLSRDLGPGYY